MTDLLSRLPFPPQPDESPRGLVVRVAEDNLCSPHQMADWLGLTGLRSRMSVDSETMAGLLGVSADILTSLGFRRDGVETVGSQQVSEEMVSAWDRRFCPGCLADRPYHRRLWEHRQVATCPVHGCEILRYCPECRTTDAGDTAGWGRGSLLVCEAGHRLDEQTSPSVASVTGIAAVHRAFGFDVGGPLLHPAFEALPGQALLDVLVFLGRMDVVVAGGNQETIPPRGMETHPILLEAGACIAQDWPARFHGLCDRLRAATASITLSAAKRYGYLHRFIRTCGDRPFAEILRGAYAAELSRYEMPEKQWPAFLPLPKVGRLLVPSTALFKQKPSKSRATDARQGSAAVGLRPAAMIGKATYYRQSDAEELRRERRSEEYALGGKGQPNVAALLGLPLRVVRRMRGARLLGTGGSQGRTLRDVIATLSRLAAGGAPQDPITFTDWVRIAEHSRLVSSVDLVGTVLSGGIRVWRSGSGSGFGALLFEWREAKDVVARLDAAAVGERVRGSELERRAYLPKGSVAMLMDAGLLPTSDLSQGYLLQTAVVETFVATYLSDLEVLRTQGMTRASLHQALADAGILPVAVLEAEHRKPCAIYRRGEVDHWNSGGDEAEISLAWDVS